MAFKPEPCITDLLRHKDLTSISKDQQVVLDKSSSWHAELKSQPSDLARIPNSVLETLKAAYLARKSHSAGSISRPQRHDIANGNDDEEQDASAASSPTKINSTNNLESSPPPRSLPRSSMPRSSISPPPRSLPRSSIARSPPNSLRRTPSPRKRGAGAVFQSQVSIVNETPAHQAGMAPPRMPRQAHLNRTFDFPSSVAEEEVELEMVQPQAIAAHLEELPNSRATISQPSTAISSLADLSSTMNTPPCAQPDQRMIMGIATQESLELQPDLPEQRRTKRMKPIQFDSTGETVGGHINGSATTSFARMASTKNYALVESSLSTDTSSIIPATLREYTQLDTILSPAKNSTSAKHGSQQDDLAEDPSSPAARLASQQEVDMEAQAIPSSSPVDPTYRRTDENEVDILKDYDNVGMENAVADASRQVLDEPDCGLKRSAVTEAELLPFDVFISHYAEYTEGPNGTLWTFIRACVCLEFMRNANSLRDCLWDEFIHAFSDSYLSYIETTAEPLPALEWFNRLPGSMKFKDMVVTRSNLDLILSSYPDAVARAKNFTKRKDENTGRISKPALANAQTNQTSADRSSLSRKTSPITRDTQSSRPTPLRLSDVRSRVSAGSPLPSTAASDISVRSSSHSTTSTLSKSRGHKYINKLLSKGRKDAKIPLEQLQKHIEKRRSSLHVDGLAETVSRPA